MTAGNAYQNERSVLQFHVLVICTANYCRSPIAEQLLRSATSVHFRPDAGWSVDSAGTDALEGLGMHPLARAALAERIPYVADHCTKEVTSRHIWEADLILTATREHRAAVVRLMPGAVGRTFTLLQLARLADAVRPFEGRDSAELARTLISEAKLARGSLQPVPGELDDLADPMGGTAEEFRSCAHIVSSAINRILRPMVHRD